MYMVQNIHTVMVKIDGTPGKYDQNFHKKIHKILTFHRSKRIESGGKSHYEINVFLQNTLANLL